MLSRPDDISDDAILAAVRQWWGIDAKEAKHSPVGFGSHHWTVTVADCSRRFVTVDDLRRKDFLGTDRKTAYQSLCAAFTLAHALHEAGHAWVVAPLVDISGEVLRPLAENYSIAVFPHLLGDAPEHYTTDDERSRVITMLTDLHKAPRRLQTLARRETFALPNRGSLGAALGSIDEGWSGGPYSEPARELLGQHSSGVQRVLSDYDRLVAGALVDEAGWTLTHGEPHSANVLRTRGGLRLIDWDTVLVAPPERDLWMLLPDGPDVIAQEYVNSTGHQLKPDLLHLYALWWDLSEVGGYLAYFSGPHTDSDDTWESWHNLQMFIAADQRWPS